MDSKPENPSKHTALWGVRFRHWVGGVLTEMRRKSPVQQWVDSIPRKEQKAIPKSSSHDDISLAAESISSIVSPVKKLEIKSTSTPLCSALYRDPSFSPKASEDAESGENDNNDRTRDTIPDVKLDLFTNKTLLKRTKFPLLRERSTNSEGNSPRHKNAFFRDSSLQSDGATSRCSSVESLLESRKVDAEAVLRGVGFGPSPARQQLARIPDRFLKPSKIKGINTEQFIKEEQRSMKMHECGVFGYRGLTGHPHAPPSSIVAKIIERISSREELPDVHFPQITPRQTDITDTL